MKLLLLLPLLTLNSLADIPTGMSPLGTGGLLPAGYRECNWIATTNGLPYIDTGIYANFATTDVEIKASTIEASNLFFGSRASASAIYRFSTDASGNCLFNYLSQTLIGSSITDGSPHVLTFIGGVFAIDGTTKATATIGSGVSVASLWLFDVSGTTTARATRKYYVKIWTGGVLLRDFVPCLNASNVPGMYDLVGATFYDNDGTGSFTYELK